MIDILKHQMEGKFEQAVSNAINNNPFKDTPFEGMTIMSAISTTAQAFKNGLKQDHLEFGLSDDEIEELVDEISTKIYNKYLKN
jgi:hypothetical protein